MLLSRSLGALAETEIKAEQGKRALLSGGQRLEVLSDRYHSDYPILKVVLEVCSISSRIRAVFARQALHKLSRKHVWLLRNAPKYPSPEIETSGGIPDSLVV